MVEKRLIDANKFEKLVLNHRADYLFKEDVVAALAKQPTVDAVEVVHGRWEILGKAVIDTIGKCTKCGGEVIWRSRNSPYAVCPNCGAKMDGGESDAQ